MNLNRLRTPLDDPPDAERPLKANVHCGTVLLYWKALRSIQSSVSKFFDVRRLARYQSQGDDTADMHVWTIDVHIQLKFLADGFDILQAFLVIGTRATDID